MPTSDRPTNLKLVAELEATWMELSGKSAGLNKKVDKALRQKLDHGKKTLAEAIEEMSEML